MEQANAPQSLLEIVWTDREERVYPSLFGPLSAEIYPLDAEMFTRQYQQKEYDPRWLFMGVFEVAPTAERNSWLYVTSGMSNPWDDTAEDAQSTEALSGIGCEFVLETTAQADWPIQRLQELMAYQVLLAHGRYPDYDLLGIGDRIPLRAPITYEGASVIRNFVVSAPTHYPASFQLAAGEVMLLAFTGITDDEKQFATQQSSAELLDLLRAKNAHPVTDPQRQSVLS